MAVLIKRYDNRKLYNTRTKKYITLKEIETLIKNEVEIKVVDNVSGEDLTAVTLSQILHELEKQRGEFLPSRLLVSLVQSGGKRLEDLRHNLFQVMNLYAHYDAEITRRIELLVKRGVLNEEDGEYLIEVMKADYLDDTSMAETLDQKIGDFIRDRKPSTEDTLKGLIAKVDQLSLKLDDIGTGAD